MALHLVYSKLITNLKNFGITNWMKSRFELIWLNLVFKPTFTL